MVNASLPGSPSNWQPSPHTNLPSYSLLHLSPPSSFHIIFLAQTGMLPPLEPPSTSLPALCPLPPMQPALASWSALLEAPQPCSQHLRETARISLSSLITHSFPFQTHQEPSPDHHRLPPTLCLCALLGCSASAGFRARLTGFKSCSVTHWPRDLGQTAW